MAAGQYRLVYVVPERFRSGRFVEAVCAAGLQLLAVDEAHCISEWGHDFRPDYARLGYFREQAGQPHHHRPDRHGHRRSAPRHRRATGPARAADLHHRVRPAQPVLRSAVPPRRAARRPSGWCGFCARRPGSGIIYASTRKRTEEVAQSIAEQTKRPTAVYHAGLLPGRPPRGPRGVHGRPLEIVVATNAFGMGIDKADVRFVVHYNLPGSLEAYYQEAGRAGRDGKPSHCLLLYRAADRYIQEYFIESAYPGRENVGQVYEFLCQLPGTRSR